MLFKVFLILGLIAGAFTIGKAFATGSIQLRGEKQPLRREDDPRDSSRRWASSRLFLS
jgi:hypothetical protein